MKFVCGAFLALLAHAAACGTGQQDNDAPGKKPFFKKTFWTERMVQKYNLQYGS